MAGVVSACHPQGRSSGQWLISYTATVPVIS